MAYQVLYRKYRPHSFDEVVGQEHIIKTLKNAIANNQIAHAYLFAGPRGTGKTSTAKLFAKMVNCTNPEHQPCDGCANCEAYNEGSHPDIFELDAASNNKVEDIRKVIEGVNYAPVLGKYKVYIIDEVHMLTPSAFNAFLKTLEEPPANVIFILATTEPQKIIPTVLSRCQRYNFTKVEIPEMRKRLVYILEKEGISYDEEALELIMSLSDGGMRDVLSILEQVLAYGNNELRTNDVNKIYGLLTSSEKVRLLVNLKAGAIEDVILSARAMYKNGIDIKRLTSDFIEILKECLIYQDTHSENLMRSINPEQAQAILEHYNTGTILETIDILVKTINNYQLTQDVLSYFEIALLKIEALTNGTVMPKKEAMVKPSGPKVQPKPTVKVEEKPINKQMEEVLPPVAPVVMDDIAPEPYIPEVIEPEIMAPTQYEEPIIEEAPVSNNQFFDDIELPKNELMFETIDTNDDYLLSIMFEANRTEKNDNLVIIKRISEFANIPEKRRFFSFLKGCEIYAASKDAIIFVCPNESQVNQINDLQNNRDLYFFLKEEYGIDKVPCGITVNRKAEITAKYTSVSKGESSYNKIQIKRYEVESNTKAAVSLEDKLTDFFGEISVEEK